MACSVVDQALLVDQEEQLVQPADHVHDALVVSVNEPPDQGLPKRSSRRSVRRRHIDPVARLESFRALKLSRSENFLTIKSITLNENCRALKTLLV